MTSILKLVNDSLYVSLAEVGAVSSFIPSPCVTFFTTLEYVGVDPSDRLRLVPVLVVSTFPSRSSLVSDFVFVFPLPFLFF